MKLIKASYEVLYAPPTEEAYILIEKVARTCYKSEGNIEYEYEVEPKDKVIGKSARILIPKLISRGHEAMLEFGDIIVKFICDRGVSHEIVRHRVASFAQESTRYCNYSNDKFDNQVTFIQPLWISDDQFKLMENFNERSLMELNAETKHWYYAIKEAEQQYNFLIKKGWSPQEARSVLPNSLKTEICVKANFREWRHIFKLRTSAAAHPQMREIMIPLLTEMKEKYPLIFGDL